MGVVWKKIPAKLGLGSFADRVNYVTEGHAPERPDDPFADRVSYSVRDVMVVDAATGEARVKVLAIETQGVHSIATAALEMRAVAERNTTLETPADVHNVLSWREGEIPTPAQAFEAGRIALAALGAGEHQYVMALHGDTRNVHLHIVWNRVHPESGRAVDLYRDYQKLDRACREIELRQGWSHERGMHVVREGDIVRERAERDAAPIGGRGPDMRAWSDERPFADWVRTAAADVRAILDAPDATWAAVHARLAELGLRLEAKGSGLIIVSTQDPGQVAKASQMARWASRGRLEAKLGPFEPDTRSAQPDRPTPAPGGAPLVGYAAYLVADDDRRRAIAGAELERDPRALLVDLFARDATLTSDAIGRAIADRVATPEQAAAVWRAIDTLAKDGLLIALDAPAELGRTHEEEPATRATIWTTSDTLAREAQLRAAINELAIRPAANEIDVDNADVRALGLRAGQERAAARILAGERLVPIEGPAGSGKSYMFARTFDLVRDRDNTRTQIGIAQGGQTAAEMQRAIGIRSMTIAAFRNAVTKGTLHVDARTDVVLDEGNLVGTADMLDVLKIVRATGAPLYVAGDTSQLPGVAAGGAFALLSRNVDTTTLGDVVRLSGWREEAAAAARDGATIANAIALYQQHGLLHERATVDDALEYTVARWATRPEALSDRLIIAFRNDDVDRLNLEARHALRERGTLADGIVIPTKRHGELEMAIGERVMFRSNEYADRDDAQRIDVRNGQLGTVTAIADGKLVVTIDGEPTRSVTVDPAHYNDLAYGYAVTPYAAEGRTVEYAAWYASRADHQGSAYVALSRARGDGSRAETDVVFASDEFHFKRGGDQDYARNLAWILRRTRTKELASDYARGEGDRAQPSAGADVSRDRYTMAPRDDSERAGIRRRSGQLRFDQWFRRSVGPDLLVAGAGGDDARAWERFHATLAANTVRADRTASGLAFASTDNEQWRAKASTLPRSFHLSELERRMGPYRGPDDVKEHELAAARTARDRREQHAEPAPAGREHGRDRVRADRDVLYAAYRAHREAAGDIRERWSSQRASERERHGEVTREKRMMRQRLARTYPARTAAALAAAWALEQRGALHEKITDERAALTIATRPSWRDYVAQAARDGNESAQRILERMRTNDISPERMRETARFLEERGNTLDAAEVAQAAAVDPALRFAAHGDGLREVAARMEARAVEYQAHASALNRADTIGGGTREATQQVVDALRDRGEDRIAARLSELAAIFESGDYRAPDVAELRAIQMALRDRARDYIREATVASMAAREPRDPPRSDRAPAPEAPRDRDSAPPITIEVGRQRDRDAEPLRVDGMRYNVHDNGDVGYYFAGITSRGREAFVDHGNRISIMDTSDRSVRAAMEYAKERHGDAPLTLHVTDDTRALIVREAARAGLNVTNPELQREISAAREDHKQDTRSYAQRLREAFGRDEREKKRDREPGGDRDR